MWMIGFMWLQFALLAYACSALVDWRAVMGVAAFFALMLVQEGSYLPIFERGEGFFTANRVAGFLLYVAAAGLGFFWGRRRDVR